MSTMRYSGQLQIRVTYLESSCCEPHNGSYRCFIRPIGEEWLGTTVIVMAPVVLSHAVDSPEAFDEAARAALGFAAGDGWPIEGNAAFDERTEIIQDWHIGRSPANAWPKEKTA